MRIIVEFGVIMADKYSIDITKYIPPNLRGIASTLGLDDLSNFNVITDMFMRPRDAAARYSEPEKYSPTGKRETSDLIAAGMGPIQALMGAGIGRFMGEPIRRTLMSQFGIDSNPAQNAGGVKPSNETIINYKGSPVVYDSTPGFPLGRDQSIYSGTGEANFNMGTDLATGESGGGLGSPNSPGKKYGAGAYYSNSPGTATGYRFLRSGASPEVQSGAMNSAQSRVDFDLLKNDLDPKATFENVFEDEIGTVNNRLAQSSSGTRSATLLYDEANRVAAERILDGNLLSSDMFKGDARRDIDPSGFNKSVVFRFEDELNQELYAIRDLISPSVGAEMSAKIRAEQPQLSDLSVTQLVDRKSKINELKKQYTGDVGSAYIELTKAYSKERDAAEAVKDLSMLKEGVTGPLPGALYRSAITEDKLGVSFNYDNPSIDSNILTEATNALGVDRMNEKLFGGGNSGYDPWKTVTQNDDNYKLIYDEKTQKYSMPQKILDLQKDNSNFNTFGELKLAPSSVAEAQLYRDAGITHGQHKDGRGSTNTIFFSDDVTPDIVSRHKNGGRITGGLGSMGYML